MSSPETLQQPDYYEILGADPLAQLDQIEDLFRQMASEAEAAGDHTKVHQAVEAFKVLSDPQLRQQYDQQQAAQASQDVAAPAPAETAAQADQAAQEFTPDNKSSVTEELDFQPDVLRRQRCELLKMFYDRRRKSMRACGMAIGGIDSVVPYSYELLEFHLWFLSSKEWVLRDESGALSITATGCEYHENNVTQGLV